jgi:hypothetical protein
MWKSQELRDRKMIGSGAVGRVTLRPVATYRPEFAAAGKQNVRLRHLLGHTAGPPSLDEPITVG